MGDQDQGGEGGLRYLEEKIYLAQGTKLLIAAESCA